MKYILSLIIGGALVVSGFGQTRNVLVGTNNTVVQPTNFWSADASNARTGLGLGSAATSPVSAFQSSSATLSNLASSNGGILTNIQASNIVGSIAASNIPSVTFTGINGTLSIIQGGTGATNAANARQNLGSTTVGDAVFIATNAASARTALGSTTIGGNIFTATDAAAVRSLLSLGTASTNPASAFQPASTNLTLLASNDGSSLTNLNISGLGTISISNISGLQSALDGKLATNGSAANLTSFPATILQTTSAITNFPAGLLRANGDGSGLTNLPIPATASNVLSTVPIAKGGTGATNASDARINLGATTVGNSVFTSTNAAAARTALSLGTASTSASTDFQPSSSALTNLAANNGGSLTNITAGNIAGTVGLASNITGVAALATNVSGIVALANGGTGGTNAATARSGIGIGTTNTLTIAGLVSQNLTISAGGGITLQSVMTNSDSFRTNIGLPWIGLTNTTASGFRTALELGTAATNPASAFQPSSSVLTNIAANNGGSLTNLQASNLVGTIAASNIPTVNLTNISGVLAVNKGGTGATNASDARTALGATTVGNSVFTATNAEAARTALSLGSAATSAVTTFQPANANLTNLSTNNGASLTGIPISGVVNLQSNLDAKLATNGNGSGLTSITAANITGTVALASNITGTASLATNVTGTVAIANGGTGATNVAGARTSLGATTVGNSLFTLVNPSAVRFLRLNADNTATALSASDFRTALSLGTAATNAETSFQPASTNLTTLAANNGSGLTNLALSNVVGLQSALNGKLPTNGSASGLTDFVGTTNPATARTNLGLGWSALTNTDATNFRNAIGLGATNNAFAGLSVGSLNTNLSTNNSSVFGVQNFIDSNAQNSFAFGGANTVSNVPTGGGSVVMGLLGRMTNQGAFLFNGVPQGGTAGNSRGNNTFAVNASNGIYLNGPIFLEFEQGAGTDQGLLLLGAGGDVTKAATNVSTGTTAFVGWDGFGYTAFGAGAARTNLDIPWTGLTNTNATTFQAALFGSNTNPVLLIQTALWSVRQIFGKWPRYPQLSNIRQTLLEHQQMLPQIAAIYSCSAFLLRCRELQIRSHCPPTPQPHLKEIELLLPILPRQPMQ
jgi:hypothetical protein